MYNMRQAYEVTNIVYHYDRDVEKYGTTFCNQGLGGKQSTVL